MTYVYPHRNLDVAGNFFVDCNDLLKRYDVMIELFYDLKSRRLKCYSDLRGSYECILKSVIAYAAPRDDERKTIIASVERYSHKIGELEAAVPENVRSILPLKAYGGTLDALPVGLRYALDGYDFIDAREKTYYKTVGCDDWMESLRVYVGEMSDAMGAILDQHSCIVRGSDIPLEALLSVEYNKYRK